MTFFTGYLAQGVGGPSSFLENAVSGYARASGSLTAVGNGQFQLISNASNGAVTGQQFGLYDASTGGNLIMWWSFRTPHLFGDALAVIASATVPTLSLPSLASAQPTGISAQVPANQQIGVTFGGDAVFAGVALQVLQGVISAAPTPVYGTSSASSTGTLTSSATLTPLTAPATLTANSGNVSIRQTAAGAYTLPTAPANATRLSFKDASGNFSTFNATIVAGTGNTIDGVSSYVMAANWESITVTYDAANHNWDVT